MKRKKKVVIKPNDDYLDTSLSEKELANIPFEADTQKRILKVIEKATIEPSELSNADCAILFHFVAHQNEPRYSFVPKKYKTNNK